MQSIQSTAKRIKELCDKKGISVNKMLIESGAGARTYHNMLAGSHPSTDKASKIADFFDCSVDYLLGRTDNPEVNRSIKIQSLDELLTSNRDIEEHISDFDNLPPQEGIKLVAHGGDNEEELPPEEETLL